MVRAHAHQGQLFSSPAVETEPMDDAVPMGDTVSLGHGEPRPVVSEADTVAATQDPPPIEIRTSTRRRKTAAAHWEANTIVVVVPHRLSKKDRKGLADSLAARLIARRARTRPTDEALSSRAAELSARYLYGRARPVSVTWSSRQGSRWGSCTAADGTIRLSDRLKGVPGWVLDAVLVHELAHLLHADHGPEFHQLVARYPRTGDSTLFLAGYAHGLDGR
jgi:predicted metal-dependent hydrolase